MSSTTEYFAFIRDQLSSVPDVSDRAMMGEDIIYCRGVVVGGIYDDRLLVKNTPAGRALMPDAELQLPYPGGKPMLLVDNVDDPDFLRKLLEVVAAEVPSKKPKLVKTI